MRATGEPCGKQEAGRRGRVNWPLSVGLLLNAGLLLSGHFMPNLPEPLWYALAVAALGCIGGGLFVEMRRRRR